MNSMRLRIMKQCHVTVKKSEQNIEFDEGSL